MNEKTKEFLERLALNINQFSVTDITEKAKELLKEDLKERVIEHFDYYLTRSNNKDTYRKVVKTRSKVKIIKEFYLDEEILDFIEKNFHELDKIIDILNNYIDELEKEEAENNE